MPHRGQNPVWLKDHLSQAQSNLYEYLCMCVYVHLLRTDVLFPSQDTAAEITVTFPVSQSLMISTENSHLSINSMVEILNAVHFTHFMFPVSESMNSLLKNV